MRFDVAACCRLIDQNGLGDLTSSHLSQRAPDREDAFLTSRFGVHYALVKPSDIVTVPIESKWSPDLGVSPSGLYLHGEIYRQRPDVQCILHCHTIESMALFSVQSELLPICQYSLLFQNQLAYVDYQGVATDPQECARLARALGNKKALAMMHHGLLTVGRNLAEAFYLMYYLNYACKVQLAALATGRPLRVLPEKIVRESQAALHGPYQMGAAEWNALIEKLKFDDPSFAPL